MHTRASKYTAVPTNINSFDAFSLWYMLCSTSLPLPLPLSVTGGQQVLNPVDVVESERNGWDEPVERNLQMEPEVSLEQRTRELPQGRWVTKVDGVRMGGVGEGGAGGRSLLAWGFCSLLDEVWLEGGTELSQVSKVRLGITVTIPRMHLEHWKR